MTVAGGRRAAGPDAVAVEEPLELRVGGAPYVTTMRTPGEDIELAHGLLAAEEIIGSVSDVVSMRYCAGSVVGADGVAANTYNVLEVALAPGVSVPDERRRAAVISSACGVCGTATIELLRGRPRFDLATDSSRVTAETITRLPCLLYTSPSPRD